MQIAVRYFTRSGNTQKLAAAIAEAVGVTALPVQKKLEGKTDILFLGAAVYASTVDESVKTFIEGLSANMVGTVYLFDTFATRPVASSVMQQLLQQRGIAVGEVQFHCKGKFLVVNRKRPDENDCREAADFARAAIAAQQ